MNATQIENMIISRGLPIQVADLITHGVKAGRWREWLPGERRLCRDLNISRGTLRAALELLKNRGTIISEGGKGNRICLNFKSRSARKVQGLIGILSPEPLEIYRPYFAVRFDHMQKLAILRRWRIHRVIGQSYFGARAPRALSRLINETPCECWVLMHSNERVQRWFATSGVPCVVSGHPYSGVGLPAVDIDNRAACRHAAGHLLSLGHTRIGLLTSREKRPGLIEGEHGFMEACSAHSGNAAQPVIVVHDGSMNSIVENIKRLFARRDRPSALLVETSNQYLAAVTVLAQLGLRVPQDVSAISRTNDPFLEYVVPKPCRYDVDPKRTAEVIARVVTQRLSSVTGKARIFSIVPTFIRGASVMPLRGPK